MRHAYLILAHRDLPMLEMLIQKLDHPDNHLFIHIDKKSKINPSQISYTPANSELTFITRTNVRWGGASLTRAYVNLLKAAYTGNFEWYHFISGADMPLMPIAKINAWYESQTDIQAVIDIEEAHERENRLKYFYFRVNRNTQRLLNAIQRRLRINRLTKLKRVFPMVYYGSAWFDLRPEAARTILDNESEINRFIPFTTCSDELLLHTVLANSSLKLHTNNHRYIDWSDGLPNPKTLTNDDYDAIVKSGAFFARKFDSVTSRELIIRINGLSAKK